jgi:hypothetical protein
MVYDNNTYTTKAHFEERFVKFAIKDLYFFEIL